MADMWPCECPCHPRPARNDVHANGVCSCELSPQQRRKRSVKALEELRVRFEARASAEKEQTQKLEDMLRQAGITVTGRLGGSPFVISGVYKGCGFYLRERWQKWVLVVEDPPFTGANLWRHTSAHPGRVLAEGVTTGAYADLVPDMVNMLHDYVFRIRCAHIEGGNFCPQCGTRLVPVFPQAER